MLNSPENTNTKRASLVKSGKVSPRSTLAQKESAIKTISHVEAPDRENFKKFPIDEARLSETLEVLSPEKLHGDGLLLAQKQQQQHLQPLPTISGDVVKVSPFNNKQPPIHTSRLETESIRKEELDSGSTK